MLKGLAAAAVVLALATGAVVAVAASDDGGSERPRVTAQEGQEGTQEEQGTSEPWLGVSVHPSEEGGVIIKRSFADGPAAQAGLGSGDRITAIDGDSVETIEALRDAIGSHAPGDEVTLTVVKAGSEEGATEDVAVTLGERPQFKDIRGEIGEKLGEHFDRFLGGSFRYLDDEGNVVELETVPGTITAISDTEITIDVNGDEGERTFSIGEDAKVPEGLESGNRVVVLLENGELKAVSGGHFPFLPIGPGGFDIPFPGGIEVPFRGNGPKIFCEGGPGPIGEFLDCEPGERPAEPEAQPEA
jgi:serine protease Do